MHEKISVELLMITLKSDSRHVISSQCCLNKVENSVFFLGK